MLKITILIEVPVKTFTCDRRLISIKKNEPNYLKEKPKNDGVIRIWF